MGLFNSDTTLMQAERILENYIVDSDRDDFYLKDLPMTEEDCNFVCNIVSSYTKNAYNFEDYQHILLLFIVDAYIILKRNETKNIFKELFLDDASHIPQHHLRNFVGMISNVYTEFDIYTFGETCTTMESVINVIRKHSEIT